MSAWTAEDALEFQIKYWQEWAETYGASDTELDQAQARLCRGYVWAFTTALEYVAKHPTRREVNVSA